MMVLYQTVCRTTPAYYLIDSYVVAGRPRLPRPRRCTITYKRVARLNQLEQADDDFGLYGKIFLILRNLEGRPGVLLASTRYCGRAGNTGL